MAIFFFDGDQTLWDFQAMMRRALTATIGELRRLRHGTGGDMSVEAFVTEGGRRGTVAGPSEQPRAGAVRGLQEEPRPRGRLVPCWWARLTVESTDTSQLISPAASARASSEARALSQVPSAL